MRRISITKYMEKLLQTTGFGYWHGTYGNKATPQLWGMKSNQYAKWYKDHPGAKDRWMGKRVLDCIGVDKYARWAQDEKGNPKYDSATDLNQEMLFALAKEKGMKWGPIAEVPSGKAIAVWYKGHIGFTLGNGKARESRGGNYGVQDNPISARPWTHYFYNPFVDYETESLNCKVICNALNVRSGPGTQHRIIKVVYKNEILRVTDTQGNWGRHQYGWSNISKKYCELAGEVQASYKVICKALNARSGPGTEYGIVGVVHKNDILQITETVGIWGKHAKGWSHLGTAYCAPTAQQAPGHVEDYSKWPVLRYGQSSPYVKRMQLNLIMQGYKIPAGATGNYLKQTEKAVLAFLKDNNLIRQNVTSVANVAWGQRCWKALLG